MKINLTLIDKKSIKLLPFDIEFFYDDRGITIVKTRNKKTYIVLEEPEIIKKLMMESERKFYEKKGA